MRSTIFRKLTALLNSHCQKHPHMKKTLILILLSALSTDAFSQSNMPEVKEYKLKNGMTVWINEDFSQQKVVGTVVVKAGAADCPDTGIAHYFEHILFKGTDKIGTTDYAKEKILLDSISAKYDRLAQSTDTTERKGIQQDINRLSREAAQYAVPNEFNNLITNSGGSGLNAATGYDYTFFYNTFAPQYFDKWAELNSERLISPVFRLFQSELETVYEEKNMSSDNILSGAMNEIMGKLFAGSPYAYPILGSTESLKNPRLSEMKAFFDKYYVAGNMGLILCGAVKADSVMPVIERTFGNIKPGNAPQRPKFTLDDLSGKPTETILIKIPLIKAIGIVYRTGSAGSSYEPALSMAVALLNNGSSTGLLDSLSTSGKVLAAMATNQALKDAGGVGVIVAPKFPFGSKKKAERLCLEQIERLKRGDFSDKTLEALKLEAERKRKLNMEELGSRTQILVNLMGNGLTWESYLKQEERTMNLTKADVTDAAKRFFNDKYMRLEKKYGSGEKDKLSQPGYKPIAPKNINAESDYAKRFDSISTAAVTPRTIDIDKDAGHTVLSGNRTLYTVKNTANDVFQLELMFHKGTLADPWLATLADYADGIGTDNMDKHEFGKALLEAGANISLDAGRNFFTVTMQGLDRNFTASLALLKQFLYNAKPDKTDYKHEKKALKLEESMFGQDNETVAQAILEKVMYGRKSSYLNRITSKEFAKKNNDELMKMFKDLQKAECSIVYSGGKDAGEIAREIRDNLKLPDADTRKYISNREMEPCDTPTVYIYDSPSARQTVIATYTPTAPATTPEERVRLKLFGKYMGGGMSSVMFQELRELRSYAYYASGYAVMPVDAGYGKEPTAFVTVMGTQADKTIGALGTLDSLLTDMPLRSKNITAAKTVMMNDIANGYPSFREIGTDVALYRAYGFKDVPEKETVEVLPVLGEKDVEDFFNKKIKNAKRDIIIVGNKSALDTGKLSRYGRIVFVTQKDIYKSK